MAERNGTDGQVFIMQGHCIDTIFISGVTIHVHQDV